MASLDSLSKGELLKLLNQVATVAQYEIDCEKYISDANSKVESLQSQKSFYKPGRITIIGIIIYLVLANAIGMFVMLMTKKIEILYIADIIAFVAILVIRKIIIKSTAKNYIRQNESRNRKIVEEQMEILEECKKIEAKMDDYNDILAQFYNEYNIQKELRNKGAIIALAKYFKSYPNADLYQAVNSVIEQAHRERMEAMERDRIRAANEAIELNQKIWEENQSYHKASLQNQEEANRAAQRANEQRQVIVDDINTNRWKG